MKTEFAFKAMAKALPYVTQLVEDDDIADFKELARKRKTDLSLSEAMTKLMPVFLVKKPDAVLGMLGAMCGKTIDEMRDLDWKETKKMLTGECVKDIFDFFIFALRMANNA